MSSNPAKTISEIQSKVAASKTFIQVTSWAITEDGTDALVNEWSLLVPRCKAPLLFPTKEKAEQVIPKMYKRISSAKNLSPIEVSLSWTIK